MITVPPKIIYSGDTAQCEAYRRFALVQLDMLKRQMSFNDLKQLTRTIPTGNGGFITCKSFFGIDTIDISMPEISARPAGMKLSQCRYDCFVAHNTEEMGGAWDVAKGGESDVGSYTMVPTDDDGSPAFYDTATGGTILNVLKSYTYNLELELNEYNTEKIPRATISIFHNKSVNLIDLTALFTGSITNQIEEIKVYRTEGNATTLIADVQGNAVNFYVDDDGNFSIVRIAGWSELTTDPEVVPPISPPDTFYIVSGTEKPTGIRRRWPIR